VTTRRSMRSTACACRLRRPENTVEVRIYGARGSIPAPGPDTLRYGGNTVCVVLRLQDGTWCILDAGTGLRAFGSDLPTESGDPKRPMHLLLSHLHYDHVIGLPFFDAMFRPETHLKIWPVRSGVPVARGPTFFDGVNTPVHHSVLPATMEYLPPSDEPWSVGSATVTRLLLNHPGGCYGMRIEDSDGTSVTYMTDNELRPPGRAGSTREEQAAFANQTDLLIVDAQYIPQDFPTKSGWGHSSVPEALDLARAADPGATLLFSHDPDRTDEELDIIAGNAQSFANEFLRGPALVAVEGSRFQLSGSGLTPLV